MGKSIETVFRELYDCEFPDTPASYLVHQELKRKLNEMSNEELEKQRYYTKMNLHECNLYGGNTTLTFGLPIASFVFSVIAILVSYGTITASSLLTAILVGLVIIIAIICYICQSRANSRKKQAMYHKDKLEIIDTILKKRTKEE